MEGILKQETLMCKLFNFSTATYYKRKRENNLAIHFIERYFSKNDIYEYITTCSLKRMETLKKIELKLNSNIPSILELFNELYFIRKNIADVIFVFESLIFTSQIRISTLIKHRQLEFSEHISETNLEDIVEILENYIDEAKNRETIEYISGQNNFRLLVEYGSYELFFENKIDLFNISILLFISHIIISELEFSSYTDLFSKINIVYERYSITEYNEQNNDILKFYTNKLDEIDNFINGLVGNGWERINFDKA